MLKTKSRIIRVQTTSQNRWVDTGGIPGTQTPSDITWYDKQWTTSEGHRGPYKNRGNKDIGGPFSSLKVQTTIATFPRLDRVLPDVSEFGGYWVYHYRGDIFPPYYGNEIPVAIVHSKSLDPVQLALAKAQLPDLSDLTARGSKLIASCLPTNPVAQGSVGLAEFFREGVPKMVGATVLKARAEFFKAIGDEYLSYQFGWLPLISDIKSAAKAIIESEKILKQLVRDSGQPVRRSASLPSSYDRTETSFGDFYPDGPWSNQTGPGNVTVTRGIYRKTWFDGCFTYHFDPGSLSDVSRIATEARLLYGLELNPEVLWNLAPWSWLVDWVTNVGSILHNVSAFQNDGLVMPYGYAMDHSIMTVDKTIGPFNLGSTPNCFSSLTTTVERKERIKATPFGFGLLDSSFTNRQWAILAALGITRL